MGIREDYQQLYENYKQTDLNPYKYENPFSRDEMLHYYTNNMEGKIAEQEEQKILSERKNQLESQLAGRPFLFPKGTIGTALRNAQDYIDGYYTKNTDKNHKTFIEPLRKDFGELNDQLINRVLPYDERLGPELTALITAAGMLGATAVMPRSLPAATGATGRIFFRNNPILREALSDPRLMRAGLQAGGGLVANGIAREELREAEDLKELEYINQRLAEQQKTDDSNTLVLPKRKQRNKMQSWHNYIKRHLQHLK